MPLPTAPHLTPTPNVFAELALIGSIVGRADVAMRPTITGLALRQFWASNRTLQQRWMNDLAQVTAQATTNTDGFEKTALELFLTELLTRVWATNWTIADRNHGHHDIERILTNTLQSLSRVRREVLLLMVRNWRGPSAERISRLDRFRRRSERWTDLLIAGPATMHDVWDFAVEIDRAQDFGLESWTSAAGSANPASLLVSAGLRVMFGNPWPLGCCRGKPFADLLAAILTSLPPAAFHADGALKPAAEWQMG